MDTNSQNDIFNELHDPSALRRKYMIPKWIRIFCWIFAIIAPAGVIGSVVEFFFPVPFNANAYGFDTTGGSLLIAPLILMVYLIKAAAAIGLLTEKNWAVKIAIADGIIGIIMCVLSMILNPWVTRISGAATFHIRLELCFIIPYLVRMINIRHDWEENKYARQVRANDYAG
jgi:hypothetical protein